MEWLAVASARTPSTAATARAETTSQTLTRVRMSGAVCRSRSVRARAARSVTRPNLATGGGPAGVPGADRDDEDPVGHRVGQHGGVQAEDVGQQLGRDDVARGALRHDPAVAH